jgi:hypothetical protein
MEVLEVAADGVVLRVALEHQVKVMLVVQETEIQVVHNLVAVAAAQVLLVVTTLHQTPQEVLVAMASHLHYLEHL